MTSAVARGSSFAPAATLAGAVLIACGVWASLSLQSWLLAAIFGAAGLALWRFVLKLQPFSPTHIALDAAAFAIFAIMRNDAAGFWQLAGPWSDVPRFNVAGAAIAYTIYIGGSVTALLTRYRPLLVAEALGLIAIPFLFNLIVTLGADWHMRELGALLSPDVPRSFQGQVAVGRAAVLLFAAEAMGQTYSIIGTGRLKRSPRLHALAVLSAAFGALTPLIANLAQGVSQPLLAIPVSTVIAALAQSALWTIVYVMTGMTLDLINGRPPNFRGAYGHWRTGAVKGAIYGGVFMFLVLVLAAPLREPAFVALAKANAMLLAPIGGALAYPLAQTLVGSADGTAPFFGRLRDSYRDRRAYARGVVAGIGAVWALTAGLSDASGGARFCALFVVGALAYSGVDLAFDAARIVSGERRKLQTWRVYGLALVIGGFVAGALGWYFDTAQINVVTSKFWAYADVNYRLTGRPLGDYTVYPLFNKYGQINLGEVAGGVRLFYSESLAGVINWSLAAPLFSINIALLSALMERSLRPIKGLVSAGGLGGLVEQAVRVMRWGLWMSPIINSFLRQSPDPTWYNQDGAVRTLVSIGADIGLPHPDFRAFSLAVFIGLLAFDWLRVLIWFDHMGLRVATLVNLTFVGGDRLDEAAGRFVGHAARTRAIPDGVRRFATWAPLLIPFYIPRGAEWDKAWTGAEALHNAGGPWPGPVRVLAAAYALAGLAMALGALIIAGRAREKLGPAGPALAGAPAALGESPQAFSFNNGAIGVDLLRDGRGAVFVLGAARDSFAIDLTRRPLDPLQSRGPFFYISEDGQAPWSIGYEPSRRAGSYSVEATGRASLAIANEIGDLAARMEVGPDAQGAVLSWRIRLADKSGRARRLRLTSFAELAVHETGAYARDLDFAAMHVETFFVARLNAILARNRLLRSPRAGRSEMAFFAARPLSPGVRLVGYEDSRARFIGEGSLANPTGIGAGRARKTDDEGKLWSFDPAASLTLEIELDANGVAELNFIAGLADNERAAADLIAERLDLPPVENAYLASRVYHSRSVEPTFALASRWPFAFSPDGKELRLTHRTPRPWAHVMANEQGAGAMVANDGAVYSFVGNAQQNGLTPFRFDSVTTPQPGQVVYIADRDAGEVDAPGFAPFQRDDASHEVVFEPGVATFRKRRGDLASDYCVFVPPDFPGDMRLLTLRNLGERTLRLRVTPFFDIVLGENANDTRNFIRSEIVDDVLMFENPRNDFQHGVAFAATSLIDPIKETVRARFFGGPGRNIVTPTMVETGAPDASQRDDGRRVAVFSRDLEIPAGAQTTIAIVLGQAANRILARDAARSAHVAHVEARLAATRAHWAQRLGAVQVTTNRPDFDRLVNTWLPYQVMASRLFGRLGPNQRGGAFGFRDQLQDVLPLIFIEPRLARAQILLHAGQQFFEGDVLKWWHRAPNGQTGLGQRTKASDPHLWLPYVLARYVEATGDMALLDENVAYLEGPAVPAADDTIVIAPRPSRESGDVYEHCRRAIDYTLRHLGANGLPLLGAGDWNDGIDGLGRQGRGVSVWMGFFFYDVLTRFAPLARARGDAGFAARCDDARAALRGALEVGWRGTHYALDFADNGEALDMPNAMTTGWPAWSGAVDYARGLAAIEGGLKSIERRNRILLLEKPFFEHSSPYPGRIADYPPGVRENGGQYSHGASWIVDGFMRLSEQARVSGDEAAAAALAARAFTIFEKISPLKKTDPDNIARYGLAPNQQPADIYEGYGHDGRGGWSWYTGSAARMVSAAYAIIGLKMIDGEIVVAPELFEAKGELQVRVLRAGGREWRRADAGPPPPAGAAVESAR
ncbi:MAG: GH36-type glycosyl hydrolase domain-containing protein [Roseiarcus sp.]